jgi:cytosine permease
MSDEAKTLLEDYGAEPVPDEKRKGWFGLGIVYWGSAVCLPAFLVAGIIAGPLTLGSAVAVYVAGSAVLAVVAVLAGVIGAHTGLSTGLSITYTFGTKGAYALQLVLFFGSWGWFGVQLGFMASGLGDGGLAFALGGAVPGWVLQIIGGALMTLTAMVGFKALEKLSAFAMPFLLVVLLITIVRVYSGDVSFAEVAKTSSEGAMPVGVAISIVISSFILGALIAPDITRYGKSTKAAGGGMVFGMLIGFPVVLTLAAIMVKGAGGEPDFSKVMLSGAAGPWVVLAVLTIVLAAWTTNHTNLYSGALSLNAMFPNAKKWMITLVSGVVGTGLALAGINTSGGFQAFLGILAVVLPPAAAVMLIDFFFFRGSGGRSYKPENLKEIPDLRVEPLVAWAIGAAAGFAIQYTPFKITVVTAIDTILIAAAVYFIIAKITSGKAEAE